MLSVGPSAVVSPKNITVNETDDVTLSCWTHGVPEPSIEWIEAGSSSVLSRNATLTVMNIMRAVSSDNMRTYKCSASNGVLQPFPDTAIVTVQCKY